MVRLSKSKRDALKASGEWPSQKEVFSSPDWVTGASEFARLSREATAAMDIYDDADFEPVLLTKRVPFFPDLFSAEEVFNAVEASRVRTENSEVHTPAPVIEPSTECAISFFFAMAAKAVETSSLSEDPDFLVPTPVVTDSMARYLSTMGEFQSGHYHFKFADLGSFVKSCLRSVLALHSGSSVVDAFALFRSPVSVHDLNFKHNLATKLAPWLRVHGFNDVDVECLTQSIFSGFLPDEITYASPPNKDELLDALRFLFYESHDLENFPKNAKSSGLDLILLEIGFSVSEECTVDVPLRELVSQTTHIVDDMTPRCTADNPGPFHLAYERGQKGCPSQLVHPQGNGVFTVPNFLNAMERIENVALQRASAFRVHAPLLRHIGCGWSRLQAPDIPVDIDDFEDFPDWVKV